MLLFGFSFLLWVLENKMFFYFNVGDFFCFRGFVCFLNINEYKFFEVYIS